MIKIREYRSDDLDIVLDIAVASWKPIYDYYLDIMGSDMFYFLYPDWKERKKKEVRDACIGADGAIACIAIYEEIIVGFITYYIDETSKMGEIGNNAVSPNFQGHGIGQTMYCYVFERLKEHGIEYAKVTTGGDPMHAPARRAYEKVGFSVQAPSVQYYKKL